MDLSRNYPFLILLDNAGYLIGHIVRNRLYSLFEIGFDVLDQRGSILDILVTLTQ